MGIGLEFLADDIRWRGGSGAAGSPVLFSYSFLTSPSLPAGLSLTRATIGTYLDGSGVLQTAAIDAARFDHTYNGSAWDNAGLLVEEQRTNSLVSPIMNSSWGANNIVGVTSVPGLDGN